jgi:hypothetical protein
MRLTAFVIEKQNTLWILIIGSEDDMCGPTDFVCPLRALLLIGEMDA